MADPGTAGSGWAVGKAVWSRAQEWWARGRKTASTRSLPALHAGTHGFGGVYSFADRLIAVLRVLLEEPREYPA